MPFLYISIDLILNPSWCLCSRGMVGINGQSGIMPNVALKKIARDRDSITSWNFCMLLQSILPADKTWTYVHGQGS